MSDLTKNHLSRTTGRLPQHGAAALARIVALLNAIGIGATIVLFAIAYILVGTVGFAWRLLRKLFGR